MPYWSSSRVGAMPTTTMSNNNHHSSPSNGGGGPHSHSEMNTMTATTATNSVGKNHKQKRSERFSGRNQPKGITMEDLKKQTALRLAQEQSRSPQGQPYGVGGGGGGLNSSPYPSLSPSNHHGPSSTGAPIPTLQPRPEVAMNHQYHPDHSSAYHQQQQPPQEQAQYQHRDARMDRSATPSYDRNANNSRTPPPPPQQTHQMQPSAYGHRTHSHYHQYNHYNHYNTGGYATALQQQPETTPGNGNSNNKSKLSSRLSHGLTVSELKEMTRARLQAEAYNQNQQQNQTPSIPNTLSSASSSEQPAVDSRPSSRASTQPSPQPVPSPSSQHGAPASFQHQASFASSNASVVSNSHGSHAPPQHQSSFLSTGTNGNNNSSGRDNSNSASWLEQQQPQSQPNNSVASNLSHPSSSISTNNSSINGSINSSTASNNNNNPYNMVVVEGAPNPLLPHASVTSPSAKSEVQEHNNSHHQFTRSNTGGSGSFANRRRAATLSPRLSSYVVHEDAASANELSLPSFSGGSAFFPPETNGNRGRTNSASTTDSSSLLLESYNRQRTSSAASMPALSHTADEFGLPDSRMVANATSSLKDNIIREQQDDVAGLTQVFGLFASTSDATKTMDQGGDNPRMRASTWSDPSSWADSCAATDFGDLRSILKLSGAEEQQQHQPSPSNNNNTSL